MAPAASLFDLSYTSNTGEEVPLAQYAGRPVLVVNTARRCAFAPQYGTIQRLYEDLGPRGLVVIGFPCDQFAHQEPGSDAKIAEACQLNFGVSFPLSTKIDVNGRGTHPVFRFLKGRTGGLFGASIKWNFTKFLVAPDGVTVDRFAPQQSPKLIVPLVEEYLAQGVPAGSGAAS